MEVEIKNNTKCKVECQVIDDTTTRIVINDGYVPKEGEFVRTKRGNILIFKKLGNANECRRYASFAFGHLAIGGEDSKWCGYIYDIDGPATPEEIQLLTDKLKEQGKRWNANKKVIEEIPTFKKGDWVRSLITGTVGKVEAFYEAGNHSRYLLSTIDGDHFTSCENVLEPYFPKEGEYFCIMSAYAGKGLYILGREQVTLTMDILYIICTYSISGNCLRVVIDMVSRDRININEIRPLTSEEKNLLDSKLAEKGLKFDGKNIVKDNTPKVGDFCIFWNSEKPYAHCAILGDINTKRGRPYTDKCGDDYRNCIPFESIEQYKNFIKE